MDVTVVDRGTWRFQQVVNSSRDAFVEVDATCCVTEWSQRAEALLGWRRDDMIGRSLLDVMTPRFAELVAEGMAVLRAMAESPGTAMGGSADLRAGREGHGTAGGGFGAPDGELALAPPLHLEIELLRSDGTPVDAAATVFATGTAAEFRAGGFLHTADADATAEARARDQLHDPLTGLASRVLFTRRLAVALDALRRRQGSIAVVVLGIDRFNTINDALGHDLGDEVLVTVGSRLRLAGGEQRPLLARLGGDQFLALFERPGEGAARDAEEFADRALELLEEPIALGTREIFLTASVGISDATDPDVEAATLLSDADAAMHEAKVGRGGAMRRFGQSMRQQVVERLSTEHALHGALDRRELALFYQPVIDVAKASAVGVEALIRWHHPTHGLVAPDRFIAVAEESGLIIPIGAWVLEEACNQLCDWHHRGEAAGARGSAAPRGDTTGTLAAAATAAGTVAAPAPAPATVPATVEVNLSARQIDHPELVATVERILGSTGLPPERLTLEITESALMRDAVSALEVLRSLKGLGVALAIDDFGTGYSSLSYLQRFPLDILKVDKSFVDDLDDAEGTEIVAAVVNLAHALGLAVVAEGVETERQLEALGELGCDYAQGYLFSRPVPAIELQHVFALERSA